MKSCLLNCLVGLNAVFVLVTRWDLRNRPKNAVRQIAQKDELTLLLKLSRSLIVSRMLMVIGDFCVGYPPLLFLCLLEGSTLPVI